MTAWTSDNRGTIGALHADRDYRMSTYDNAVPRDAVTTSISVCTSLRRAFCAKHSSSPRIADFFDQSGHSADRPPDDRSWPEAEWQFPGDRKRKRTFDGQSVGAVLDPKRT